MAYELIYTSAREGVQMGATGFCTVAMTDGLPPALVRKLEGLTGYRHLYSHFDENYTRNPPSFLHYSFMLGTEQYDVVGRVCSCRRDYTGRSNKIAHFLVLTPSERRGFPAGPAAWCAEAAPFLTEWEGAPRLLPQKTLPSPPVHVGPADLWEEYAGDAGWAGHLADAFLASSRERVYILFDPTRHTRLLEMVNQAITLLPPQQRWRVAYNTYLSARLGDMACNWVFCPKESEAMALAGATRALHAIDLCQPGPCPGDSPLMALARTGRLSETHAAGEAPQEPASLEELLAPKPAQSSAEQKKPTQGNPLSGKVKRPQPETPPPNRAVPPSPLGPMTYRPVPAKCPRASGRRRIALWIALGCLLVTLLTGGGLFVVLRQVAVRRNAQAAEDVTAREETPTPEKPTPEKTAEQAKPAEEERIIGRRVEESAPSAQAGADKASQGGKEEKGHVETTAVSETKTSEEPPSESANPDQGNRQEAHPSPLPPFEMSFAQGPTAALQQWYDYGDIDWRRPPEPATLPLVPRQEDGKIPPLQICVVLTFPKAVDAISNRPAMKAYEAAKKKYEADMAKYNKDMHVYNEEKKTNPKSEKRPPSRPPEPQRPSPEEFNDVTIPGRTTLTLVSSLKDDETVKGEEGKLQWKKAKAIFENDRKTLRIVFVVDSEQIPEGISYSLPLDYAEGGKRPLYWKLTFMLNKTNQIDTLKNAGLEGGSDFDERGHYYISIVDPTPIDLNGPPQPPPSAPQREEARE